MDLKIDVLEQEKIVLIWVPQSTSFNWDSEKPFLAPFLDKKYKIAVMRSGTESLLSLTTELLKHNNK